MKTCVYCGSKYDDNAMECPNCGGKNYSTVCGNCGTVFEGFICPKCGVRAGDNGQKCPVCGARMFNGVCPACAKKQAAEAERQAAREAAAKRAAETAELNIFSKILLIALTLVFPFITNWYVLFSKRTRGGLRAFGILYGAFYIYAMFLGKGTKGVESTYYMDLATIIPIVAFGLQTLWKWFRSNKKQVK